MWGLEEELDTIFFFFFSNLYGKYLTKEALVEFWDFRIGGQIILTVKYADNSVLLAKEEMVL